MKDILQELNNLKIKQKSLDFIEDLPEDLYKKFFKNHLKGSLEIDKHRWYETSIDVFKIEQGLLGVRSITDVVGENNCVEDNFHTLEFFEVEEVTIITYKKIK